LASTSLRPTPVFECERVDLAALESVHAVKAAEIHAEGQPGTFLSSLGIGFLEALYAAMARSPGCFGQIALCEGNIVGVVVGTTEPHGLFTSLVLRTGPRLALGLAGALLRHPSLIPRAAETLAYSRRTVRRASAGTDEAELLFIGTREGRRGQGVATALFHAFAESCRRRGATSLGLSVDDGNEEAKRFYERRGMRRDHTFVMYGRTMHWYQLSLASGNAKSTDR
jgi:ribosomal protein S18 acetylase RimI-like enzyme